MTGSQFTHSQTGKKAAGTNPRRWTGYTGCGGSPRLSPTSSPCAEPRHPALLPLLLPLLPLLLPGRAAGLEVQRKFLSPTLTNNFALDGPGSRVYLAAVNRLFQLSGGELSLEAEAAVGPVLDSPLCHAPQLPQASCEHPRVLTNNYNKILQPDPEQGVLVVCGSIYQGLCQLRSMANISAVAVRFPPGGSDSVTVFPSMLNVAANHPNASTVGLVLRRGGGGGARLLARHKLSFVRAFLQRGAAPPARRPYAYLALNSEANAGDKESPAHSLLARICLGEPAEATLNAWRSPAAADTPGPGPAAPRELLFGVFERAGAGGARGRPQSALCVFRFAEIEETIRAARNSCFVSPAAGMVTVLDSVWWPHGPVSAGVTMPGSGVFLEKTQPVLSGTVAVLLQHGLSAVAVASVNNYTVVFLGTASGALLKASGPAALGWVGSELSLQLLCSAQALSALPPLRRGSWLPCAGIICSDSCNLIPQHSCITRSPFTFGVPCSLAQDARYFE
uniref:Sema domain-containing protein n=1 Tax=Malurus cyaneus samueli TaxID=2593467 RepID=A0A8C5UFW0_9PASS